MRSTPGFEIERALVAIPGAAVELNFHGSPSPQVNGIDPFAAQGAPVGLACRLYITGSGLAGAPTLEQLVEVLAAR